MNRSVMEIIEINEINVTEEIVSNITDIQYLNPALKIAIDVTQLAVLIFIMLAMGSAISIKEVLQHIKKPIGVCCGMISQFVLLPLCAFGFSEAFQLKASYATGVLVISCSPGGVLSNTFTYFCDGDLALSVTMTTASTLLALGFIPFNMWLYGKKLETSNIIIPYDKIAMSLVYIAFPVLVGMLIRWKAMKLAYYITKFGSYSGAGLIFLCIILQIVMFPSMFDLVPWKLYLAVVLLPTLGLCIGYGLASIFRQTHPARKTIAFECGIQNVPLALTIISMSFRHQHQMDILVFPSLYGFSMMTSATVACLLYQCYKKWFLEDENQEKDIADAEDVIKEFIPKTKENGEMLETSTQISDHSQLY